MREIRDKKKEMKDCIIDIIIECLLKGQDLPSEKDLTKRLEISRSTLRELLIEFEATGIIVATQGRGREVRFPDVSHSIIDGWNILSRVRPESLLELLDVRYQLEKGFLLSAIESLQLDDLQMMRDLVNRMEAKARKNQSFKDEDQLFHRILYSRVDNMVLDQLLKSFWDLFEQMVELHKSDELLTGAGLHSQLYEAILIQDIKKSERLLEMQFNDIRKRISIWLANRGLTEV